jgi:hypothetical protein
MINDRRKQHHGMKIKFKKGDEYVGQLDMAPVDQRFIDEDEIVGKVMRYIALRTQYSRRVDDSDVPEWDTAEIEVNPHLTIPIGRFGRLS